MKILLVEDQSSYATTLAGILEGKGHEVTRAVDPSRADGILSENDFGLIVVDLNMRTIGLTKEEIRQTANGLGTGWIWLIRYVLEDESRQKYRDKVVICSSYTEDFQKVLPIEYGEIRKRKIPFIKRENAQKELLEIIKAIK
jgi:CheY-like chemotaxis protein